MIDMSLALIEMIPICFLVSYIYSECSHIVHCSGDFY
jgi:hypothetical protein